MAKFHTGADAIVGPFAPCPIANARNLLRFLEGDEFTDDLLNIVGFWPVLTVPSQTTLDGLFCADLCKLRVDI
jgi:hypothetical protein